jgi:hypothetical protein
MKVLSRLQNEWLHFKNNLAKLYRKTYSGQHQLTSTTSSDRYPELFTEARQALAAFGEQTINILSFGCSTGEECFSLRNYFPKGNIIGADINNSNLRKAREKNTFNNVKFIYSTPEGIAQEGPYHIIFCLSVLCRWEDTKDVENCEDIYPFEKFQATVRDLSDQLHSGGLLVIYNSNFRFEETVVFKDHRYEIVTTPTVKDSGFVHKFDKFNKRVRESHPYCIYRKRA